MKQTSIIAKLTILIIVIVLTASLVLVLVKMGVVNTGSPQESVLNLEFIPIQAGSLTVRELQTCDSLTGFDCRENEQFSQGQNVYVLLKVETGVEAGRVLLVRNYQIRNQEGKVIFASEGKNNLVFEDTSDEETELIAFSDFFGGSIPGEYELEAIVESPTLGKTAKATKRFTVE